MAAGRPRLTAVLETVLYYADQDRAERFYKEVLGMRLLAKEPGRSLFFRIGDSMVLLFDPEVTLKGGSLPPHGARGPVHTCFIVPPEEYGRWKKHLESHGVEILHESDWSRDDRSFFFNDTEGNLLEIANADIWPR